MEAQPLTELSANAHAVTPTDDKASPGSMMSMGTPYAKGSAHSSTDVTSPPDAGERPEASPYTSAMAGMRYVSAAADAMSTTTDKSAEDAADDAYAEDDDEGGEGDDKAARSRERNREHARRTRMRKKAHLQGLQQRVGELKHEADRLDVALGEVTTANILVDISHKRRKPDQDSTSILEIYDQDVDSSPATSDEDSGSISGSSRASKKMRSASASDERLSDEMQIEGGPHVNWKDGYTLDAEGRRQPLSSTELEKLRRERNRMHAKMTRDRKKRLIADLEQTISELETKNRSRRQALGSTLARNLSHNSLTRFGAQYGVTGDEGATSRQ
mmetsp:Transcript_8352/g.19732  ORF Transcript_8352/g.19732 Transcript_8352/m.19732 type:complete len:330 (+) Transcript_8352:133-1122(+)